MLCHAYPLCLHVHTCTHVAATFIPIQLKKGAGCASALQVLLTALQDSLLRKAQHTTVYGWWSAPPHDQHYKLEGCSEAASVYIPIACSTR